MLFVPPDAAYLGYFDLNTLACLFALLAVIRALRNAGFFETIARAVVRRFKTLRGLGCALVGVTLVCSMFATNDMALLMLLPLSTVTLAQTGNERALPFTFVMQAIVANLGGMILPCGNPQNIFLNSRFGIAPPDFLATIALPFAVSVALIAVCWWNDENLIRLFRDDPAGTAVALPAFRYQCFAILLQPVIVVTNMTFQSVGKAGRATFLACCRQGVCFIPLILVLPRVLGLVGVELCQPIADALTCFISLPFLLAFLRQLEQMDKAEASHAPAQL